MVSTQQYVFRIAEFYVGINFVNSDVNGLQLIPSFRPFLMQQEHLQTVHVSHNLMFSLTVDDTLRPIPKEQRERIRTFDTGNGDTIVDLLPDGGYQYIIKDIHQRPCCLLQTDKHFTTCRCALNGNNAMRSFGLNNALMLVFAFNGCKNNTLLIHASLVRHKGYGYAFIAKSRTGKSTQVSMWLKHIPNCDLMNDDNPIVRIIHNKAYIYGSPWSGKTPCYRDVKAPLGAITRIDRASVNSVDTLRPVEAFASLLPACSSMKWDKDIFNDICTTVTRIIEVTPQYVLHCRPDREAAEVCAATIVVRDERNTDAEC